MAITLSISLLGGFSASLDEKPLNGLESSKVRALLAYLAILTDRPHSRDELAGLLWPDFPNQLARKNLRQALNNLRHALDDHLALSPFILVSTDAIKLNPERPFYLDVRTFQELLEACEGHPHRRGDACHSCARRREQAVELYHGDFLDHFFVLGSDLFEEWAAIQRENLRESFLAALLHLSTYYERIGYYEKSRRYAARQLELEPWREKAHRQIMRILATSSQRSAALAQYRACQRILQNELGVEPEPATQRLFQQIAENGYEIPIVATGLTKSNIPPRSKHLVGRSRELKHLMDLLEREDCRLVTLTGPGGVGKTSLAVELARSLTGTFSDGVFYVPLASIETIDLIVSAIAQELSLPLVGASDPFSQLQRYLAQMDLLLILDNFDHLLDGAGLIVDLLRASSHLAFLVTSRERLHIPDEWVIEVKGLPLMGDDCDGGGACDLFVQVAQRTKSDFSSLDGGNDIVARICQLVEGLPLAIEMAAGWVRYLSLHEIAAEIDQGLNILVDTQGELNGQPSLRTVFSRSVALLAPAEYLAFTRMSIFRGGFDRYAALHIADAPLSVLASLIDKSLIRLAETGRYEMHILLRQYAEEHLVASGELDKLRYQYLDYFFNLASLAEEHIRSSRDRDEWMRKLQENHYNLQIAIIWALDIDQVEIAAGLVNMLWRYWHLSGRLREGRDWVKNILTQEGSLSQETRARTHFTEGVLAWHLGVYSQAHSHLNTSVLLMQSSDDQKTLAYAMTMLGFVLDYHEEYTSAKPYLEKSVELFRSLNDPWGLALSLYNRGYVRAMAREPGAQPDLEESLNMFRAIGDAWGTALPLYGIGYWMLIEEMFEAARVQLEISLETRRKLGDQWLIAQNLNYLGEVMRCLGEYSLAEQCYQESLLIFDDLGSQGRVAISLHNLAYVALHQSDNLLARTRFQQAYELFQQLEDRYGMAACLEGMAAVMARENQPEAAVKSLVSAQSIRGTLSFTSSPADRKEYANTCVIVRSHLGEKRWSAAWNTSVQPGIEETVAGETIRV